VDFSSPGKTLPDLFFSIFSWTGHTNCNTLLRVTTRFNFRMGDLYVSQSQEKNTWIVGGLARVLREPLDETQIASRRVL
jgi:hypothetical protein